MPRIPDAAKRADARRMLGFLSRRWLPLATASVLLGVSSLLGLALPLVIRWLVDTVFVSRDLAQLNVIALGLLALFSVQSLLSVAYTYIISSLGQRLVSDLRLQVFEHVQTLPLRFFAGRRVGELVSRVSSDVTFIQGVLTDTPIQFLRQSITLIGGLILMFAMNWQLTLLTFLLVPLLVVIGNLFGRRLGRLSTEVQDRLAEATVVLEEMLSGIRVVKSFGRESFERERFSEQVESAYLTAMQRARVHASFSPLINLLGFLVLTFVLWFGGREVVAGTLTPGDLIALLFYMMMVAGPLGEFAGLYGTLSEALGAGRRVFELLDAVPEPLTVPGAVRPDAVRGRVEFRDVAFTYDGVQKVLDGVSLCVEPGEGVAVVGPSGVGKTTLVNLIPRLYDPTAGRVELDGRDLRELDLRWLRDQVGLVPQETFLFGGTIRENIAYGRPGASDAEIEAAARAANADEFVAALPDRYETIVGEKGIRLSMGQRQRVTIARVLLKDPRVLILDEATSSLDSVSERLVQQALERLMQSRTAFVIAHRLSTVQHADRIIALQNGRIVEEGSHAELLSRGGLYQQLWSLQFAEIEPEPAEYENP